MKSVKAMKLLIFSNIWKIFGANRPVGSSSDQKMALRASIAWIGTVGLLFCFVDWAIRLCQRSYYRISMSINIHTYKYFATKKNISGRNIYSSSFMFSNRNFLKYFLLFLSIFYFFWKTFSDFFSSEFQPKMEPWWRLSRPNLNKWVLAEPWCIYV